MTISDLNKEIKKCKKCRLCETRTNALCGEGNPNSKAMLIAQAPGRNENIAGKMFIGPSGKVLDELLREVTVDRNEIYMTNLVKCILPNNRKPKQDEIEICSRYLNKEIELTAPKALIPLGYHATRYVFREYALSLPSNPEHHTVYGRIFWASDVKILPLRHPAALLYNSFIRETMLGNYRKIRTLLEDCKWYPACPMKIFYEQGKLSKKWVELYCKGDWETCIRYQMEERGGSHPDWMLPDGSIDERLREKG